MGCTYFVHEDGSITATMYTADKCFKLSKFVTDDNTYAGLEETPNLYGEIPIVEFEFTDRMGVFEKVIPILDSANVLNSDRVNDVVQHVQSLLWMHNCMIDDEQIEKLMKMGVISTKSNGEGKDAKITYLSQTLNQTEQQTFADFLYRQVEEITSTPSWQEASGGSTTGAMQLSNGWQSLELSAKSVEQNFTEPENQILRLVAKTIELDKRGYKKIKNIDVSDIEPHFTRNKNYDLVSKANALSTLLNAGVDGLWAFQTVGLFSDSEQAWIDSRDVIEKIQEKLAKEQEKSTNADTDENGNGGANNDPRPKVEESVQPSAVAQVENT
jgi:SPP1 family phage portal protein